MTSQPTIGRERRTHERYHTAPMHHAISIRPYESERFMHDGHAYDVSEGGLCFELDDAIKPGTDVGVMIHLPAGFDAGPGRAIFATGRVIWRSDMEEPGPVRMGLMFHGFSRAGDEKRLRRFLNQGIYRIAA